MGTIALLTTSNIFMTFVCSGHLKYRDVPLHKVLVISWMIAYCEYCFQDSDVGFTDLLGPHNPHPSALDDDRALLLAFDLEYELGSLPALQVLPCFAICNPESVWVQPVGSFS